MVICGIILLNSLFLPTLIRPNTLGTEFGTVTKPGMKFEIEQEEEKGHSEREIQAQKLNTWSKQCHRTSRSQTG